LGAPQRHDLRAVAEGLSRVRLFIEKVGIPSATAARWLELPPAQTLRLSLAGKWLLEFPTVHVALRGGARESAFLLAASEAPEAPPPENRWL